MTQQGTFANENMIFVISLQQNPSGGNDNNKDNAGPIAGVIIAIIVVVAAIITIPIVVTQKKLKGKKRTDRGVVVMQPNANVGEKNLVNVGK